MLNWIKNIYNFYVERYKKRFLYCFAIYYGLLIIGMIIGLLYPPVSTGTAGTVSSQFTTALPGLMQAIGAGDVIKIIVTIFIFNSILGSSQTQRVWSTKNEVFCKLFSTYIV